MINRDKILADEIARYVEYFRSVNGKMSIKAFLTILEQEQVPPEAIQNGLLVADFAGWTLDQVVITGTHFECTLAFKDDAEDFVEYPVKFPIGQLLMISKLPANVPHTESSDDGIDPVQKKRSYMAFTMVSGEVIKHPIKES